MNPVTGLSLGRILVGLLTFVRPALAGRLFGIDMPGNPQLPTMARLFAVREVALGVATLVAPAETRKQMVALGVAVDAADGVASVMGVREKSLPKLAGVMLVGTAIGAVYSGVDALRRGA
jgi:hypothetical protein